MICSCWDHRFCCGHICNNFLRRTNPPCCGKARNLKGWA